MKIKSKHYRNVMIIATLIISVIPSLVGCGEKINGYYIDENNMVFAINNKEVTIYQWERNEKQLLEYKGKISRKGDDTYVMDITGNSALEAYNPLWVTRLDGAIFVEAWGDTFTEMSQEEFDEFLVTPRYCPIWITYN